MENGTSILFGLPGVAVVRVERAAEDGEIVRLVHLTTVASSAAGCPVCGVISTSVRQYRTTRPRDLPYGEERLAVRWHKRQYRCREEACPRKAFTESVPEIPARGRLTGRLCRKAAAEVASGRSVSAVAAEYRVSWPVIHRHYPAYADQLLTEPDPPVVLGIDETRRGAPKWVHDAETGRWVPFVWNGGNVSIQVSGAPAATKCEPVNGRTPSPSRTSWRRPSRPGSISQGSAGQSRRAAPRLPRSPSATICRTVRTASSAGPRASPQQPPES